MNPISLSPELLSEIHLGDAIALQRGFDITKAEQSEGDVPIVSSSGVSSFHNKWRVAGPGVVIGRKGTLGTVHYLEENFWPHDTTLWVKDFKGSNPRFVAYFLKTLHLENFDTGASNPTLNRNHVHKIRVKYPRPEAHSHIVAVLSAYDDLIENNRRRIALLERMAEQLYREWFVRFRLPGYQQLRFEKGKPARWVHGKLSSLISPAGVTTGKRPKGGAESTGIPSIGAENVDGLANYNYAKEKFISEEFFLSMKRGHVHDRDVLFYKDGADIGRVGLFQDEYPHKRCCVNEHVFLLRASNPIYQYLIYFYLRQQQVNEYVKLINKNAAQPGINRDELLSIPILVPVKEVVVEFNRLIEPMVHQIFNLAKANKCLASTRDLLLPRLISGKLRVDDLDIQFPPSMQTEHA